MQAFAERAVVKAAAARAAGERAAAGWAAKGTVVVGWAAVGEVGTARVMAEVEVAMAVAAKGAEGKAAVEVPAGGRKWGKYRMSDEGQQQAWGQQQACLCMLRPPVLVQLPQQLHLPRHRQRMAGAVIGTAGVAAAAGG